MRIKEIPRSHLVKAQTGWSFRDSLSRQTTPALSRHPSFPRRGIRFTIDATSKPVPQFPNHFSKSRGSTRTRL